MYFFFTDTTTTDIYTLSLHDALPIYATPDGNVISLAADAVVREKYNIRDGASNVVLLDRKSTRLNSSHVERSYAVFCLKKKKSTRRTSGSHGSHSHRTQAARR